VSNVSRLFLLRLSVEAVEVTQEFGLGASPLRRVWVLPPDSTLADSTTRSDISTALKCSADMKLLALSFSRVCNQDKMLFVPIYPRGPPLWPLALLTVARPLARPTPLPRTFLALNIGAFLL
jgi:hypothetical protein